MSDLAIVAIPSQDDYVWKISSEKVPHLTLMVLKDSDENPHTAIIESFLGHVVETSMRRFMLDVDRRGTLGDKDADVLFFKNPGYNIKNLETVRRYLLTNPHVFTAYNSMDQFPEWTPHLTLGYPEAPAKEIERDYPITWVNFDRIALWTGDYEGPEFLLKDQWDEPMAMSDGDGLTHYGIKGMKWGVHKNQAASTAKLVGKAQSVRKDATKTTIKSKVRETGGLHKVNDKDLQTMLNRMDMEKRYSKFMAEDSKRRAEGAKAVGKILFEVGKVAVPIAVGLLANRAMNNNSFRTNSYVSRPAIDVVSKTTDLVAR